MFRNRFLSSAAFFLKPDDGTGQGAGNDQGQNGGNAAGDTSTQAGQDNGNTEGAGGAGEGTGGDDAGGAEDDGGDEGAGGEDGGEDDPYAGLTPEQREKIERAHQREIGWRDRQIGRLTGKRRQAEEDTRAAGTIIDQNQRGAPSAQQPDDVQMAARQLVAQERYDEACNNTDAAGRTAYGNKWGQATEKLRKMGGVTTEDMADIVQGTDNPAVVLYSLAQDPDLYDRVMNLPPAKRRSEFVKLGLKEPPKSSNAKPDSKRPGDAPPPPRTLNGGSRQVAAQTVDLYKDNVDDDAWYRARNETRRKKFSNVQ